MTKLSVIAFIVLLSSEWIFIFSDSITCKDNNNDDVDWFMALKFPRLHDSSNINIKHGLGLAFLDVRQNKWRLGGNPINGTGHALYYTLQQLYSNSGKDSVAYIEYNDETPGGSKSEARGHTKGVVVFDESKGFWLIHSVPKYPPSSSDSYGYPDSGEHYGQSFLCITMNYKYLEVISQQLLYTYPEVYDINVPTSFTAANPSLVAVQQGHHVKTAPFTSKQVLISSEGQSFTSFAKAADFNDDLYAGWVAPNLGSNLFVESWQNGAHKLASNCSTKYHVYNIRYLSLLNNDYKETQDHSKWAVSSNRDWTCIGGINRQAHQEVRGGGTVCVELKSTWLAFNSTIKGYEDC